MGAAVVDLDGGSVASWRVANADASAPTCRSTLRTEGSSVVAAPQSLVLRQCFRPCTRSEQWRKGRCWFSFGQRRRIVLRPSQDDSLLLDADATARPSRNEVSTNPLARSTRPFDSWPRGRRMRTRVPSMPRSKPS